MHSISVVIADADRARHVECERLLLQEPDLTLVAQVSRWEDVFPIVTRYRPRVLVLSLSLWCESGGDPLSALHSQCPETIVLLLPADASQEDQVLRALASGARGYLTCEAIHLHLAKAVHSVDQGEAWVPRKMLGKMVENALR